MWWSAILPALGINAGMNILRGRDPLQGAAGSALTAGVTGGLLDNAIPGADIAANPATSVVPGSIESSGMVFNEATGTYLDPSSYIGESMYPIYTGGEGVLSNAADEVKTALGNMTPQNLMGVAGLLQQPDTSQYQSMAGTGGGVSRGSGQGLSVQMPQAKVFKRRKA